MSTFRKVELGAIANFINGFAFKPSDWNNKGKKIIRIQNLTDTNKPYNLTDLEIPEKYKVKKGTFSYHGVQLLMFMNGKMKQHYLINIFSK
ncbi:MAG TPA: hypothetical protein ENK44_02490 [Caldithrix abyssi]|uniref:Uncharacterized protein n=1 Tax=Caldithrix abyssi TaxID=187145 RepID=A0A7V4TYM4_CALAY|nr:hypothetical protein [Caldithrix abyssi]